MFSYKITIFYISMVVLSCTATMPRDIKMRHSRFPRSPRVVYDRRYDEYDPNMYKDHRSAETDTDIVQLRDNFGPKIQQRLAQVMPTSSQSNVRDQYRAFKRNTYGNADHDYSDRDFDFEPSFQANEDQSASFEHGFVGNFQPFEGLDVGEDFFNQADSSGEKKENSAEASNERGPEFEENDDLSA